MIYGIDVIVVEPGAIKTPIWQKGERDIPKESDYYEYLNNFAAGAEKIYQKARPVEDVANVVVDALTNARPKTRYVVSEAWFSGWFMPRLLSDRMLDRGIARHLGLRRK